MIFKALSYWIFGATVAYVMGWFKKKDEREPDVLHGDPKTTNRLINGCPFDNPLTSFINSFASRVSRTQLKQLVLIQLAILLPGIPRWHYNFLAVAHKEKCKTGGTRSAVHTVMPNIHLPTGKRLQPYWHWSDKRTVEAGQEIYNLQHNLPSPKQYEHVFGVDIYSEKPNTRRRAFILEVQKHLIEIYRKGNLRSLDDVKSAIEEPFSCQVVHNGRSKKRGGFISVECPAVSKNRIRLYGRLFDPEFLANQGTGDMRKAELSDSERDALIEHYRRVLTEGIIKKYEDYKKKYALGPLSFWVVHQAPKEFQNYLTTEFLSRCIAEVQQMESPAIPQPELAQQAKSTKGRKDCAFSLPNILEFFRIKLRKQKGDEENELQRRRDLESFVERTVGAIRDRMPFIRETVHRSRGALEESRRRLNSAIKTVGGALTKRFARPVDLDGPSTERDVKGPER